MRGGQRREREEEGRGGEEKRRGEEEEGRTSKRGRRDKVTRNGQGEDETVRGTHYPHWLVASVMNTIHNQHI